VWLHQLLASSELHKHFEKVAAWADQNGCIQSDLSDEECLQELIDHLALKKFSKVLTAARLQRAVFALSGSTKDKDDAESTAVSSNAQVVGGSDPNLVNKPCEMPAARGNAKGKVAVNAMAKLEAFPVKPKATTVSKAGDQAMAKAGLPTPEPQKEVRKRIEDMVPTVNDDGLGGCWSTVSSKEKKKQDKAPMVQRKAVPGLSQAPATAAKVVSKVAAPAAPAVAKVTLLKGEVREDMAIEDWHVGYIIGKGGSRAKHIQNSFGVQIACVDTVNPKAVIIGKKQNVERAKAYINSMLEKATWGPGIQEEEHEPWMDQYVYKRPQPRQ